MNGNNTAASGTGIFCFLLSHKFSQSVFLDEKAILIQGLQHTLFDSYLPNISTACRIFQAFETVLQRLLFHTVLNFALAAMFRFSVVVLQAAVARLFMITMLIAHQTVHTACRKHRLIEFFFGHFHSFIILFSTALVKSLLPRTKKATARIFLRSTFTERLFKYFGRTLFNRSNL